MLLRGSTGGLRSWTSSKRSLCVSWPHWILVISHGVGPTHRSLTLKHRGLKQHRSQPGRNVRDRIWPWSSLLSADLPQPRRFYSFTDLMCHDLLLATDVCPQNTPEATVPLLCRGKRRAHRQQRGGMAWPHRPVFLCPGPVQHSISQNLLSRVLCKGAVHCGYLDISTRAARSH